MTGGQQKERDVLTCKCLCLAISRSRIQFCLIRSEQQTRLLNSTKLFRTCHFNVLSLFQRFIPISEFYPHFSVLSPFRRFIPIQRFAPFQRFIPISAFYPYFSVLSPFQRFIPISVSVFSFRFRHSVSAFYPDPKFLAQVVKFEPVRENKQTIASFVHFTHWSNW